MANYIFLIHTKGRKPQKMRIKNISNRFAQIVANRIMDENGKASVTYHAEK